MEVKTVKHCVRCDTTKPVSEFNRNAAKRDGLQDSCRDCRRVICAGYRAANREKLAAADREYAKENPDKGAARSASYYRRLRARIFAHYGERCACCGSEEKLTVDHVNGDGAEHRIELLGRPEGSGSTETLYRWIIANGFPDGFQTLCRPCNASKLNLGSCRIQHTERN
jgi:hypothetical protein